VTELEQAANEYSEQVSEAVSADADTSAYVEELERRVDMLSAEEQLPSGDTLAAELTRFLREREEQDKSDDRPEGPASQPSTGSSGAAVDSAGSSPAAAGFLRRRRRFGLA